MRIITISLTAAALALVAATPMQAQAPAPAPARQPGPIVPSFGGVFDVPSPGLPAPADQDLKLRFDVNVGPEPGELNAGFDTVARFLNMHARAGVPRERVKAALVIHGTAGKDTLKNDEYRKRFGKDNPNLALLDELKAAGVRVYLCGQTSMSRNLPRAVVTPAATIALSAMTAHLVLEKEGYVLNPF
jgi:intracellular sulfur oxidation DsrE/DsrF family protein